MTTRHFRIGVAMERESGFARAALQGISDAVDALRNKDIALDLRVSFIEPEIREVPVLAGCDGYIGQVFDDLAPRLRATHKPIVDLLAARRWKGVSTIGCNHEKIAEMAAAHFVDHGHRAFAFVGFGGMSWSDARERFFVRALRRRGFGCEIYRQVEGAVGDARRHFSQQRDLERPPDFRNLKKWLKGLPSGTGVFCCNDHRACQVVRICEACERAVPGDLAVLGVDNDALYCNFANVKLSTIANDAVGCGRAAVELMRELLVGRGRPGGVREIDPVALIERESTNLFRFDPPWLAEAVRRIRTGYAGNLSTAEIVAATGLSHTTVEKVFRAVLGHSVQDEIVETRFRAARRLLGLSGGSIGDVAKMSGFGSLNYFSASFNRRYHMSPAAFRERARETRGAMTETTLSGAGSLVVSGYVGNEANPTATSLACSLPSWRLKFVVSGPNVTFNGGQTLFTYAPIEVKNGAVLTINSTVRLWKNNAALLVEGATAAFNYLSYNAAEGQGVTLAKGARLTVPNISPDGTMALTLDISGGSTLDLGEGTLKLAAGSRVTLADTSVLRCKTWPTYSATLEDVTWNLTGGTFRLAGAATTADELSLVGLSQGTAFVFEGVFGTGTEVLDWKGDMTVGTLNLNGITELRLADDAVLSFGTSFNQNTENSSAEAKMPRIDARKIVFSGADYPFRYGSGQRYSHVIGPVTMQTRGDITASNGKATYTLLTGDGVVDTADPDDATVKHTMCLKLFGARDYATLRVRGGGKLILAVGEQLARFQRVVVEEGTTLELPAPEGGSSSGILNTESFTLGANAKLLLSVKTLGNGRGSRVNAHQWSIDPTASIEVADLDTLTGGARTLLEGDTVSSLPENAAALVTLSGTHEGWSVREGNGAVYVSKSTGAVDGAYTYEWTGLGANANFSDEANWYGNAVPLVNAVYAFGAGDAQTAPYFDHVWSASDKSGNYGYTIGCCLFRETAVRDFTVKAKSNVTYYGHTSNSSETPSDWSVASESFVPQAVQQQFRNFEAFSACSLHSSLTLGDGTATVWTRRNATAADSVVDVSGDVRVWADSTEGALAYQMGSLRFALPTGWLENFRAASGLRYTVLGAGTTQRFYGQIYDLNPCSERASLAVDAGASLVFNDATTAQDARFGWGLGKPGISRVDGTLELNVPFVARGDSFYAGSGEMKFNKPAALFADGVVATIGFADEVRASLPTGGWATATAAAPAGALSITVEGAPKLCTAGDWTYGVAEGVAATSTAADRALKLEAGAALTLDAGAGTATIAEAVTGRGTLTLTNGTFVLSGDVDSRIGLSLAATARYRLVRSQLLKSFSAAPGATLAFSAEGARLEVTGNARLAGVRLDLSALPESAWQRVLVAAGSLSAEDLVLPPRGEARIVALAEGGAALEARKKTGLSIIVR